MAPHDQLEEIFGGGVRELPHAEVVDDQERHHRELREVGLPRAGEGRGCPASSIQMRNEELWCNATQNAIGHVEPAQASALDITLRFAEATSSPDERSGRCNHPGCAPDNLDAPVPLPRNRWPPQLP